ncbi:MAG: hypothetical protein JW737_06990, partial [Acidobacteria bacterium]|nr:hypothetical protein [Acidobacteriota bacterium]
MSPRGVYLYSLASEINKTLRADVVTVKYSGSDKIDESVDFSIIRTGSEGAKLRNVLGFNKEASKLVKKEKFSHIIASSWEYAGSAAYNISKKTGIPYSLILFDKEIIKLRGRASLFTKFRAIESLARNVFTTSAQAALLLKKTGVSPDKLIVLSSGPPVFPEIEDSDKERDSLAEKYNLQHPDTILFSKGISDEGSAFDILLWALFLLKQKTANFSLLLFGDGKNRDKLEIIIKDLKLDEHVRFVDDREDSIRLLNVCDIFVSLFKGGKARVL